MVWWRAVKQRIPLRLRLLYLTLPTQLPTQSSSKAFCSLYSQLEEGSLNLHSMRYLESRAEDRSESATSATRFHPPHAPNRAQCRARQRVQRPVRHSLSSAATTWLKKLRQHTMLPPMPGTRHPSELLYHGTTATIHRKNPRVTPLLWTISVENKTYHLVKKK